MKLNVQKRLAADILKCSKKRIRLGTENAEEIKEAITKADIKELINDKIIVKKQKTGVSRVRARKRQIQKKSGKRRGHGKRKGKSTARLPKKEAWMAKIRVQRSFVKELKTKELIDKKTFRATYNKCKGGFFRSKRHIKIYLTEHNLIKKEK